MPLLEMFIAGIDLIIKNFHILLFGLLVGMALGVIPGMGGSAALAILVPLSLSLDPIPAFIMLGAALGSTTFAGSLTAILINAPGTASNAATVLDGYPMTQQGRAKDAIGAAAMASAAGAVLGLGLFIVLIPALQKFALLFGSTDIFWLALIGIAVIPIAVRKSLIKGLIAGGLGLLVGFHGYDFITGAFRFEYILAINETGDIHIVPVIIGLFAIAEMMRLGINEEIISSKETNLEGDLWRGMKSIIHSKYLFLQSSLIGFIAGTIPGIGGSVASLISYGAAANLNISGEKSLGEGNIAGIIASESANDCKDGGQLVPTFALGIPGSSSTAILLGAFLAHGLIPGPQFIVGQLLFVIITAQALIVSNVLTSVLGVLFVEQLVKVTTVDMSYLFAGVISLTIFSAFIMRNNLGDVYIAVIFGFIGLLFMYLDISRVSMIIAIVLARIVEENFFRLQILVDDISYFWENLLTGLLVLIFILILAYPTLEYISSRSNKQL